MKLVIRFEEIHRVARLSRNVHGRLPLLTCQHSCRAWPEEAPNILLSGKFVVYSNVAMSSVDVVPQRICFAVVVGTPGRVPVELDKLGGQLQRSRNCVWGLLCGGTCAQEMQRGREKGNVNQGKDDKCNGGPTRSAWLACRTLIRVWLLGLV